MNKKCTACNGKGYHTQWRGVYGMGDFIGDASYWEQGKIHKNKCSRCDGTGKVEIKLWWRIKAKFLKLTK